MGFALNFGIRPSEHLTASRHSSGDQSLQLLSEVIQLMLRGEVLEEVRLWICGASLMALRKPNGSIRPMAVGETLRGLCSKVAVELVGSSVRTILEPVQVGVQTRAEGNGPLGPSLVALAIHPCIIEVARVAGSQHPGGLDFKSFFLDDGAIAGQAPAVQLFLATFEHLLHERKN